MKQKPLLAFRLTIGTSRWFYVEVEIHPTKKAMHAAYERFRKGRKAGRSTLAICAAASRYRNGRLTGFLARLYFWRRHIGGGTVSHEITHAALAWAMAKGITLPEQYRKRDTRASRNEEAFAWAIGAAVSAFYNKLQRQAPELLDRGTTR